MADDLTQIENDDDRNEPAYALDRAVVEAIRADNT